MQKGEFKEAMIKAGWKKDGYNNLTTTIRDVDYRCQLRSRSFRVEKNVGGAWEFIASHRYKVADRAKLLWV